MYTAGVAAGNNPVFVTGRMPIKTGDIVRLENCYIDPANVSNQTKYGQNGWGIYMLFFGKRMIEKMETYITKYNDKIDLIAAPKDPRYAAKMNGSFIITKKIRIMI